jgi:hypothetical protein
MDPEGGGDVTPLKPNLKKTYSVYMISIVLCDLPFNRNQPMNLADD